MGENVRKSNYELLRIISIMLIMMMHSFGKPLDIFNEYMVIFVNVIGNVGTTCFIILSGYFGVKCNVKKLVRLDMMIILYCLVGVGADYLLNGSLSMRDLVSAVIPITSHRYWFLSCYFFLCILSPFLNEYLDKISRERMKRLIFVMLLLFAALPTVFGFDVMQDGGKGLVNMTLAYMIGRYLGKYGKESRIPKGCGKCGLYLVALFLVNFGLNAAMYRFTGSTANYYARDNSLFTIAEAVLVFRIFERLSFTSRVVNWAAANVVAVYVLESVISHILRYFFDYTVYAEYAWYVFLVLLVVAITFVAGILIEAVRKFLFGGLEGSFVDKIVEFVTVRVEKWEK